MARLPRIVIPHTPHHIVVRGNNRRRIFSRHHEYDFFVYLIGRAQLIAPCPLHAAVLMTNHVHLVVTPPDARRLSCFMKHLTQRYAQARNARRGTSGRLFEERYFSRPILSDEQLALTLAYIELNPVRGGLVEQPNAYRWSTYHCHVGSVGRIPSALWTASTWYGALGATTRERATRYAAWVEDCRTRGERPIQVAPLDVRAASIALRDKQRERRPDGASTG